MSKLSKIKALEEEIANQEAELKDYQQTLEDYAKLEQNYFKVCYALLYYAKPIKEPTCDLAWNTLHDLGLI